MSVRLQHWNNDNAMIIDGFDLTYCSYSSFVSYLGRASWGALPRRIGTCLRLPSSTDSDTYFSCWLVSLRRYLGA